MVQRNEKSQPYILPVIIMKSYMEYMTYNTIVVNVALLKYWFSLSHF